VGWEVVDGENFRIFYKSEDSKIAFLLRKMMEDVHKEVTEKIGFSPHERTKIYIVSNQLEFNRLAGKKMQDWVVGFASKGKNTIVLQTTKWRKEDLDKVLKHEYSHIVLGEVASKAIPHWFDEGLAMYVAGEWSAYKSFIVGKAVLIGTLLPLKEIREAFPVRREKAQLAYAQSLSFLAYLMEKYGREDFHRLIQKLSEGANFNSALQISFGKTLPTLEREWRMYLKKRYRWITLIPTSLFLWGSTSLLFLLAYLRKRRESRRKMLEWEEEERAFEEEVSE
jgi:hypothetical protein